MEAQAIFRWWYGGGEKLVLYTKEIKVMICYTKGEGKKRCAFYKTERAKIYGKNTATHPKGICHFLLMWPHTLPCRLQHMLTLYHNV